MAEGTGAVKSPWSGALLAVAAMAVVSVVALVQKWDAASWLWAAAVCAGGGLIVFLTQARRNRQLDAAARQARQTGNGPDIEQSTR
ncbi:hypothetical protein [Actinoplanes missouriensis]|nr:hypothetical protein [Actinoplanes missouriensis]